MAYEDDIDFVLSEYARFASLGRGSLSQMSFTEVFSTLPHPSGHGVAICGEAAQHRMRELAEHALSRSAHTGRIDLDAVVRELKSVIVQRFLVEKRVLDNREAQRAVSSAIRSASRALQNTTHLIPCHLGKIQHPDAISIG